MDFIALCEGKAAHASILPQKLKWLCLPGAVFQSLRAFGHKIYYKFLPFLPSDKIV